MNIAISSTGKELDSEVDSRFGRAQYFIVVDTEGDGHVARDNTQNLNAMQGAGIQAAKNVVDMDVKAVLTGNMGPKAFAALQGAGVAVHTGVSGTVREAIDAFRAGTLPQTSKPTVEGHWM